MCRMYVTTGGVGLLLKCFSHVCEYLFGRKVDGYIRVGLCEGVCQLVV